MSEEETIRQTWAKHWSNLGATQRERVDEWDSLSEIVLQAMLKEIGDPVGKTLIEGGCGTGRISAELARRGAHVTCLDITAEALDLARLNLKDYPTAEFVQGSILSMPRGKLYDIVWNSGVMEHFTVADQQKIVEEFLAVLKPGGKIVMLIPYSFCVPYRLAKFALEVTKKWPYGREIPYRTFAGYMPKQGYLYPEYTVSFLPFFMDFFKFCPPLKRPCQALTRWVMRTWGGERFARIDRVFSRLLGGYLIVSVVKHEPPG